MEVKDRVAEQWMVSERLSLGGMTEETSYNNETRLWPSILALDKDDTDEWYEDNSLLHKKSRRCHLRLC
jgi:hypothetical protein